VIVLDLHVGNLAKLRKKVLQVFVGRVPADAADKNLPGKIDKKLAEQNRT